jgi:hypothetical protein
LDLALLSSNRADDARLAPVAGWDVLKADGEITS